MSAAPISKRRLPVVVMSPCPQHFAVSVFVEPKPGTFPHGTLVRSPASSDEKRRVQFASVSWPCWWPRASIMVRGGCVDP